MINQKPLQGFMKKICQDLSQDIKQNFIYEQDFRMHEVQRII